MATVLELIKAAHDGGGEPLLKAWNEDDHPRADDGKFTAGETVRFDGASADGKFSGFTDVKIINPHSNADKVTHTEGKGKKARDYEGGNRHIATATVERPAYKDRPALRFEAYHYTLGKPK